MNVTVTIADIREAGHCVAGASAWFARHQIPFRPGVKNGAGWPSEQLLATGDDLAVKVVQVAERRVARG